jgi:hypothetical protein
MHGKMGATAYTTKPFCRLPQLRRESAGIEIDGNFLRNDRQVTQIFTERFASGGVQSMQIGEFGRRSSLNSG